MTHGGILGALNFDMQMPRRQNLPGVIIESGATSQTRRGFC
jgi:hypothetical protein